MSVHQLVGQRENEWTDIFMTKLMKMTVHRVIKGTAQSMGNHALMLAKNSSTCASVRTSFRAGGTGAGTSWTGFCSTKPIP